MMLASIVLLVGVAEISVKPTRKPPVRFFEAITLLAVLCAIGRFVLRGKYVREGSLMLAQDQADARALKRWQTGHIIGYALSEAVALYGFNLRYAGFTLREVAPFYLAGLVLMFFSRPRLPEKRPA